jgi:uncharacterized RDD family membrane protein YckC
VPPPALSPGGQPLADFGTRLLAILIDTTILTGVAMVITTPVIAFFVFSWLDDLMAAEPGFGPQPDVLGDVVGPMLLLEAGLLLVLLVAYYVYYVEMMHRSGQTVGKKAMKLRVVPLDPTRRLTRGMAAKRYLVENVAGTIVPFLIYLDGLWQLWDKPYQQTLHDKFAQTVVVKVSA